MTTFTVYILREDISYVIIAPDADTARGIAAERFLTETGLVRENIETMILDARAVKE